ncbi:MAG: hypothetical protein Q4F84_07140, partial [Fibrobacter sp.]|nr:hypothetical protein [Fibrobacter sp.]
MKYLVMCLLMLSVFCAAPMRDYLEHETSGGEDSVQVKTELSEESVAPIKIPIDQWSGKRVFVLDKPEIFRQHGYELYFCRELDSCKENSDSARNLKNGRIRHEVLSGQVLTVVSTEPLGEEWLVTFENDSTKEKIYAATNKGALKDIGFFNDLENARKRWLGKVVFSKKGTISTEKEGGAGFSSLKVGLRDSLSVVDVKWGCTPIPVDPIWLVVETLSGSRGFIPVRFSWTNSPSFQVQDSAAPWDELLMEQNPAEIYKWDENTWEIIDNHRIVTG